MSVEKKQNEKEYSIIETDCHLYKMRWVLLFLFMVYAVAAGMQWMQYTIICNITTKYYNVKPYVVEWTSMLHMLAYIISVFPALWILDQFGNRVTMILAASGICIGAWIKYCGAHPDRFTYVLIGQSIEAAAQVLTFGLAGSVTAAWFGHKEIALAGSLALFGDQFGCSMGFMLPPLLVEDSEDPNVIGQGISNLAGSIAIFTTVVLVSILLVFKDKPDKPPSKAQMIQKETRKSVNGLEMFIKMVKSGKFQLMCLTYGLNIGVWAAVGTLLNQFILHYFPGHAKDAGMIGSLMVWSGLIGAVLVGLFLDRKYLFKETTVFLYICSAVFMVAWSIAMEYKQLLALYIIGCLLGGSMLAYFASGLQMSFELTYPASEGIAAGVMILAIQTMGLILTPISRYVYESFGPFKANICLTCLLIIGAVLTTTIPRHTKRQDAESKGREGTLTSKEVEAAASFIMNIDQ